MTIATTAIQNHAHARIADLLGLGRMLPTVSLRKGLRRYFTLLTSVLHFYALWVVSTWYHGRVGPLSQQHSTGNMPPEPPRARRLSQAKLLSVLSLLVDAMLVSIIIIVFFINKFPYESGHDVIKYYIKAELPIDQTIKIGNMILDEAESHRTYESFKKKLWSNSPGIDNNILHPNSYLINSYDMISHGYKQLIENGRQYYITITMINRLKECFSHQIDNSKIPDSCHASLHSKYGIDTFLDKDSLNEYELIHQWLIDADLDASKSADVIDLLNYTHDLYKNLNDLKKQLNDGDIVTKFKLQAMIDQTNYILAKSFDDSAYYIEVSEPFYIVLISVLIYILFKIAITRSLYKYFIDLTMPNIHH